MGTGHPAGVGGSDLASDIGELGLVAHCVIEEFDATALGDGVEGVGGGDAVEVCATACTPGAGVGVAGSVARGGWEKREGPFDFAADKGEGRCHVDEEEGCG